MNFCLFTMHSERNRVLWEITLPNKEEYCRRHGYDLQWRECSFRVAPGWERIEILIHLLSLPKYDWVYWLGTDCLITNLTIPLDTLIDPDSCMVLAYDAQQNQADSVLFRAGSLAVEILNRVMSKHRSHAAHTWAEQQALEELIPEYRSHIKIVPQRRMNAYESNNYLVLGKQYGLRQDAFGNDANWQHGDFVLHTPGLPMWRKAEILADYVPLIVR